MNGKKILANPKGTLIQIVQEDRRASPDFLEAWYALVLRHLDAAQYYLREDCLAFAPAAVKRRAEWLLAVARHEENTEFFVRESSWPLRVAVDLAQAKDSLLKALELEPNLDEARLRLGHVASLMGYEDDAMKDLGKVVAPMDARFVCLARMFEAQIHEKRNDLERAQTAYERALDALPGAQSARVGLARVMFARGHRDSARSRLLQWFNEPRGSPPRDPWAEYYYGFEGQMQQSRARLRAAVLRN